MTLRGMTVLAPGSLNAPWREKMKHFFTCIEQTLVEWLQGPRNLLLMFLKSNKGPDLKQLKQLPISKMPNRQFSAEKGDLVCMRLVATKIKSHKGQRTLVDPTKPG